VTFEQVNLIEDVLPSPATDPWTFDLILCRNVLLYFDGNTARAVVRRLGECLDERGWLLLSQVEAALGVFDGFELDAQGGGVFRKVRPVPTEVGPPAHERSSRRGPVARPSRAVPPPSPPVALPPLPISAEEIQVPAGYGEALQLWRENRPEDALRRLQVEGSHDQLTAPLHYLQGLILLDQGRAEQALAAFRRCTFADPSFALGHLAQAGLLTRAGKRSRAKAALENAVCLVADLDPEAHVFPGDELRAGALLELVDAHRQLLGSHTVEVVDG
jgi:chemotaxis protein methyltransferase CheR